MRTWPMACVPSNVAEAVLLRDGLGVAQVLHDLERVPERQHLAAGDVLEVVGQALQVAVVRSVARKAYSVSYSMS